MILLICFGGLVLFVADLFHPVDHLAIERFLNGDMRHGRGRRGAVPVFLARCDANHVTGADFFDRASPTLRAPAAGSHDEGLPQRVGVPRCPSAGFERDTVASRAGRFLDLKQRVNAHRAGKPVGGSFAGRL